MRLEGRGYYAGRVDVDGLLCVLMMGASKSAFAEQVGALVEGVVEVTSGARRSGGRNDLQHRYEIIIELMPTH